MLSRSNLYNSDKRNGFKSGKYTPKKKSGLNGKKTGNKNKFYKSTAWKYFSRYILISSTIDVTGTTTQCCTCGKWMAVNSRQAQAGHYVKVNDANSTNYSTAFVEANVNPQCEACNRHRGGVMDEMASYIEAKHGEGTVKRLMELKKLPLKLDDAFLSEIADTYRKKFYEVLEQKGIENPWKKK